MVGSVIFRIWCPDIAYTNISQGIKKAHLSMSFNALVSVEP
jgi:hypothetical protein